MARKRYVDIHGTIGAGGLNSSAVAHTFAAPLTYANGTAVPTLAGTDHFLLSILNTAGDAVTEVVKVTAYNSGTGAATIARAQYGTTGVAHLAGDKVVLSVYPDDFDPDGVLATTSYNPGTMLSVATSTTVVADVDAANLAVTFTVPASGRVLVSLEALVTCAGGSANSMNWHLREGSSTIAGPVFVAATTSVDNVRGHARFLLTGLTPGDVKTYKFAHSRTGTGSTTTHSGGIAGPTTMVVQAA